jgi:phosphoserine phosphatase
MTEIRNDSDNTDSKRFLVVLDVDSTLIENEAIELLANQAGSLELVAAVTERAMRGEIDFAESLKERVATLAGLPESVFDTVRSQITVTTGASELISTVKAHGGHVGVVSGGFHELLDPLAESLGLDFWKANHLEIHDGQLTGKVRGGIVDTLIEWANLTNTALSQTVAIGDGANDLTMMGVAGLGIAFCAKPIVQEQADIALNERDLSKALELFGL